jgi:hypothetical protein
MNGTSRKILIVFLQEECPFTYILRLNIVGNIDNPDIRIYGEDNTLYDPNVRVF